MDPGSSRRHNCDIQNLIQKMKMDKLGNWTLADIYHYVLRQSPSPEAAKIAISEAHQSGKLPLHCERCERKACPDIRLKPGEEPPPSQLDIVTSCCVAWGAFSHWDWERSYATRTNPETNSHFEYLNIAGRGDDVLRLWPLPATDDVSKNDVSKLVQAVVLQLEVIERERESGRLGIPQETLREEVGQRLGRSISLRTLQTALAVRRRRCSD